MSTLTLRREAKATIDVLSEAQLRVASDFLAFVKDRKADAATLELLSIPGFAASFARGIRDIKAGRTNAWRKVRRRINMNRQTPEETGVTDVRRTREAIARQHDGNLAEHVAESNRIANDLREELHLGPVVQPPARRTPRSGTEG